MSRHSGPVRPSGPSTSSTHSYQPSAVVADRSRVSTQTSSNVNRPDSTRWKCVHVSGVRLTLGFLSVLSVIPADGAARRCSAGRQKVRGKNPPLLTAVILTHLLPPPPHTPPSVPPAFISSPYVDTQKRLFPCFILLSQHKPNAVRHAAHPTGGQSH